VAGAGTVHVAGNREEFLSTVDQARTGLSELPFLLLGQQSLADPTRAPEGKHTAWAYTHGPQDGVDWTAATPVVAERMEAQVERFAPGFRELILARSTLGPRELEAHNRNLVGGDLNGGAMDFGQVIRRPALRLAPWETPLEGVYLCSASTPPGGGVHGMCGFWAAEAALKVAR
jgi:phytoene dehydrogenase-like protein